MLPWNSHGDVIELIKRFNYLSIVFAQINESPLDIEYSKLLSLRYKNHILHGISDPLNL